MSRSTPAVSVIVTVYNGERYLEEALRSILDQSFHDLELVVVDDGSTDGSVDVARAIDDDRMVVISEGRLGRAEALNRALRETRAPFVALMDADDVSLPQRIERQHEFLVEHPDVGFAGTWFTAVSEAGESLYTKTTLLRDADLRRRFLLGTPIAGGTTMVRRTVFDRVGTFREAFVPSEDSDLWRRAILHFEAANIPEVLYLYRMRAGSFSDVQSDVQDRHRRTIVADLWEHLDVPRYGVRDLRRARTFYASFPGQLGAELEREYLWHESALCKAFFRHGRIIDGLSSFAALMLEAPASAPVVGKGVRAARRLRRGATLSSRRALRSGK
jgi:glycosyltransferase involved in cell wall biosynthesis